MGKFYIPNPIPRVEVHDDVLRDFYARLSRGEKVIISYDASKIKVNSARSIRNRIPLSRLFRVPVIKETNVKRYKEMFGLNGTCYELRAESILSYLPQHPFGHPLGGKQLLLLYDPEITPREEAFGLLKKLNNEDIWLVRVMSKNDFEEAGKQFHRMTGVTEDYRLNVEDIFRHIPNMSHSAV